MRLRPLGHPSVFQLHEKTQATRIAPREARAQGVPGGIERGSREGERAAGPEDRTSGVAHATRTFKSEVDARLFTMHILAKGWAASAGTINPYQPKRVIGVAEIERWADPGLGG